jgi:hypothetical protein
LSPLQYLNMEKHLNQKIEQYQVQFKNDIKEWLTSHHVTMTDSVHPSNSLNGEFLQFIFDYNNIQIGENDLKKRKRIKNIVPQFELCIANKANGEQCTRRKKSTEEGEGATNFCGTHIKGIPHGIVINDVEMPKLNTKVEVWIKDIKGINYYIDANHNVYKPEDILTNKVNPAVIAKWSKSSEDVYSIPQFGI